MNEITVRGAQLIANAMVRARQGLSAEALLEALALNVGMEEIGKVGEKIRYDYRIHEDIEGGMLKGDKGTIINVGWRLGEVVIKRAETKPK